MRDENFLERHKQFFGAKMNENDRQNNMVSNEDVFWLLNHAYVAKKSITNLLGTLRSIDTTLIWTIIS